MRESWFKGLPMGRTELVRRGSYTVVRNKFRNPDARIAFTYAVMKGSEEVKSFDNSREAFALHKEKADKEASNV